RGRDADPLPGAAACRSGHRLERSAGDRRCRGGARVVMRRIATGLLALVALTAIAAPFAAPHDPSDRFADFPDAPPTRVRLFGEDGRWCGLCFHPQRLVSRL